MTARKTNAEFAKTEAFVAACEIAGTPATKRQASKFRNRYGKVYNAMKAEIKAQPVGQIGI